MLLINETTGDALEISPIIALTDALSKVVEGQRLRIHVAGLRIELQVTAVRRI